MSAETTSLYTLPERWVSYDAAAVLDPLVEARSAAGVLNRLPYLQQWIDQVHEEQLRLEAAGTSRIEGAEFSDQEQEIALASEVPPHVDLTRSQRQLRAADATYRWLRSQPTERPITSEFVFDIHRRMVTGCDDDHCEPGALRPAGWNVTFGTPRCRGVEGGDRCQVAFNGLCAAIAGEYRQHDRIIQALAAHYHIGAMHPFGDGNGRTSRALEAFMLRQAGVSGLVMVSLSNYYYEHKDEYLAAMSESRRRGHDLTPFLRYALPAVSAQCNAVAASITDHIKRTLFRQFAQSLFGKLRSPRRRALAARQLHILEALLEAPALGIRTLLQRTGGEYQNLKHPASAWLRDIHNLRDIGAIQFDETKFPEEGIALNLDWPQQLSESVLLDRYDKLPSAASARHPAMAELTRLLRRRLT